MFKALIFLSGLLVLCSESRGAGEHPSEPLVINHLDGQIYYGAAPKSDADYAKLCQLGVKRIVDIRTFKVVASAKEKRRAAEYGIAYRRIPMGFRPTRTGNVPRIQAALANSCGGAVYFHCNLGLDRAGMLVALYRTKHFGWDPHQAFAAWKAQQFNTNLEGLDRYYWQHVSAQSSPR